ncbi:MAG: sulfotransferase, partial [Thaumarchaeota archaeon]
MKKPNFFIVGAPKCGTHAMYTFLKAHPEIFMPERKEFQYFATDLVRGTQYELSEEEYLSYFRIAKDEKRLGEASTWYLYSKKAASNIKKFNPHAKIIVMLRHPIEMMYSYW